MQQHNFYENDSGSILSVVEFEIKRVAIPTLNGFSLVAVIEIVRCEADNAYTTVFLTNGTSYVTSRALSKFADFLPKSLFFRIHQSHLVNLDEIREFRKSGSFLMSDDSEVYISRRNREEFLCVMAKYRF
ncbi:MAG: LytTR family transcriptional regulator [Bacteroidetes bacterium]|nr:LytTR family transcriptional regulator [Bacteroidota bacterium]